MWNIALLEIALTMAVSPVFITPAESAGRVPLDVHLESPSSSVLLGEPVLLYVTVRNTGQTPIEAYKVLVDGYEPEIKLLISKDGQSFEQYQMGLFGLADTSRTFVQIRPGQPLHYTMRILYARMDPSRLAFPEVRDYWLKVRYPRMARPSAERTEHESNTIKITVREPIGGDADVWKITRTPEFVRFLQSGVESSAHPGVAIRAAELLDSIEHSGYHHALRYAVGAYYFKERAADYLDYTRREPFGSKDIQEGDLFRRVLGVESESYGTDWRLFRYRVICFPSTSLSLQDAVEIAWKETGVPLEVAPELRFNQHYSIPGYDATLNDFMLSISTPGLTAWVRNDDGYRLEVASSTSRANAQE